MRPNRLLRVVQAAVLLSITTGIASLSNAAPLASAFTYQGQLNEGANHASGLYDFTFELYDAATSGSQVGGSIQMDGVPVSNGLFSVTLNFGSAAFDGNARWLEIHVRANGGADAVTLSPRQALRATPYSLFALTSGALNGVLPDSQLSGNIARLNAPQTFTATLSFSPPSGPPFTAGSSERVPNLNADLLDGLDSSAFWKLSGNAGTTAGTHFLGTTDNQPLELKVNGQRALRLEPTANSPNVVGGHPGNFVSGGVGVTIGGGGSNGWPNTVVETNYSAVEWYFPHFAAILGGAGNSIRGAPFASIGGGRSNSIVAVGPVAPDYSGIGSGSANQVVNAAYSAIGGGQSNLITGTGVPRQARHGTIGGGQQNVIDGSRHGVIAGGRANSIVDAASDSTIAGGALNRILGGFTSGATIGGGMANTNSGGEANTISGGANNRIFGGGETPPNSYGGTIGGGRGNRLYAPSTDCTIAGGSRNTISSFTVNSAIGGGDGNQIMGSGGVPPTASCTIAGGSSNTIWSYANCSVIGGGGSNQVFGSPGTDGYATIPGGEANVATNRAFAAGRRAKAVHSGSFVWGDATDADVSSSGTNQFTVRASGGTRIFSDSASSVGVQLLPGDNAWSVLSDRNAKQNLEAVDCAEVLEKVAALPVTTWQLKSQPDSVRHMGPMAQDFQAAFGLGASERVINTSDADGVALAAIKGLHEALKAKDKKISELEARLGKLERLIADRQDSLVSTSERLGGDALALPEHPKPCSSRRKEAHSSAEIS